MKQIIVTSAAALIFFLPSSVSAASAQPKVTGSLPMEITELPRTGFPLAAWGLAALIPIGTKLIKTGSKKKPGDHSGKAEELNANTIWVEKQFKH